MLIVIKAFQAVNVQRLKLSEREMGNILTTREHQINTGIRIQTLMVKKQAKLNIYSVLVINAVANHGHWGTRAFPR